jgi:hypothetical protein
MTHFSLESSLNDMLVAISDLEPIWSRGKTKLQNLRNDINQLKNSGHLYTAENAQPLLDRGQREVCNYTNDYTKSKQKTMGSEVLSD